MAKQDARLREHLVKLLRGRQAHVTFEDAIRGWPARHRGTKPKGTPHSAWQLLEHLRLAQRDIYDFCVNPNYQELRWPDDYWPRDAAPANDAAWRKSVQQFLTDRNRMIRLVRHPKTNLYARIPWGSGQTILREALLVADHNAYHIGQLVLLRRLLGAW
jgi:hypothetical protein